LFADAATALLAGAHDLTVTPQVLMEMVTDALTEDAVERFTQDWQKMNKL
jgi:transaldolase